jgi:ribose 5-phosphate isomerase B
MKIVLGCDHAGFHLKEAVAGRLRELGHEVSDLGGDDRTPVDYPDVAGVAAAEVAAGRAELAILACGTGIGMAMAANKVPGILAAVCRTEFEGRMARRHNDANVLCLGERVTGAGVAVATAEAFVDASFDGGRHARRVEKIRAMESSMGPRRVVRSGGQET